MFPNSFQRFSSNRKNLVTQLPAPHVCFVAASRGYIDEVIYPHSTRKRIALGLRKLRTKQLENPWKKHDNIPL